MDKNILAISIFLILIGIIGLAAVVIQFLGIGGGTPQWKQIGTIWQSLYWIFHTNLPIAIICAGIGLFKMNNISAVSHATEKEETTDEEEKLEEVPTEKPKETEEEESPPKVKNEWEELIEKFLSSEREKASIGTNLPSKEVLSSLKAAVKKMNKEDAIKVVMDKEKVHLVKKHPDKLQIQD